MNNKGSLSEALSVTSMVIALIVSLISSYLFLLNKITFEILIWIVIGSISVVGIFTYQEIKGKFKDQEWEQKKLEEKLKIDERLAVIEVKLNNLKK